MPDNKKNKKEKGNKRANKNKSSVNNAVITRICIESLLIFLILLVGTLKGGFFLPIDNWAYSLEATASKPVIPVAMMVITSIMSLQGAIILGAIALAILLLQKKIRQALFLVIAMGAGFVIREIAKMLVHRARPEIGVIPETGFSFPSGHATMAVLFFGLVIYLFKDDFKSIVGRKIFIAVCVIVALLVSYSRLYLEVHWLSDVLAGIVLGIFILFLGIIAFESLERKSKKAESLHS
jgi:undecaprenyl-diphosphatase